MRIIIDRAKCIGAGNCVLSAPNLFSQDDEDGLVVLLNETPEAAEAGAAEEARSLCPAKVIDLEG